MSQPTPVSPTAAQSRMSFPRWVRAVSEQQLLVAAQRKVAHRYGTAPPPRPSGVDIFWQRVYAPLFYALPFPIRQKVANAMPGSHRQTWHTPQRAQGPAV